MSIGQGRSEDDQEDKSREQVENHMLEVKELKESHAYFPYCRAGDGFTTYDTTSKLAPSDQSEDQDRSSDQQTETGQPQQRIAFNPVHLGNLARLYLIPPLQGEKAGPLLVLELAVVEGPEKDHYADYKTREHVGQKVWVIHDKCLKCLGTVQVVQVVETVEIVKIVN
jgi:hypothetical protein